jgi:hypothetical protein
MGGCNQYSQRVLSFLQDVPIDGGDLLQAPQFFALLLEIVVKARPSTAFDVRPGIIKEHLGQFREQYPFQSNRLFRGDLVCISRVVERPRDFRIQEYPG